MEVYLLVVVPVIFGAVVGAVVGTVSGAVSGIIQRLIPRWQITQGVRWVLVSTVSLAVGLVVGAVTVGAAGWGFLREITKPAPLDAGPVLLIVMLGLVVILAVTGVIGGTVGEIIQGLVLKRQVSYRSGWRILVGMGGWAIGLTVGGVIAWTVGWGTGQYPKGVGSVSPVILVGFPVLTVGLLVVTWIASGASTGIVLIALNWLWQRFRDRGLGRIRSQRVHGGKIEVVARDRIN